MFSFVVLAAPPTPCTFWSWQNNSKLNNLPVPVGVVISAYDPQNVLCGQYTVGTTGEFFFDCIGDDPDTAGTDEGANSGDTIKFYINNTLATVTGGSATWQSGYQEVNIKACTDADGDGYSPTGGDCGAIDCNDNNWGINPGAAEICNDSLDNDCDGTTDEYINNAPTAVTGGPYIIDVGQDLQLSGAGNDSNENCGDSIVSYWWDLDNDGNYDDATGATPAVPWSALSGLPQSAQLPIAIRVTDENGATGSSSTTLTIYDNRPFANFTANPNPAACFQSITFNAASSSHGRPDRDIVSYAWIFGDGASGSGATATHAYGSFNSYTAILTVTDNNSPAKTDTENITIKVNQGNQAPVANAGGPYKVVAGNGLQLSGINSYDLNAACGDTIVQYSWDINNDGSGDATGVISSLTWVQMQTAVCGGSCTIGNQYTIRLTVVDSFGASGTSTTTIKIIACNNGDKRLCSNQDGVCAGSQETCTDEQWLGCDYSTIFGYEANEATCDNLDNDCDSTTDEDCFTHNLRFNTDWNLISIPLTLDNMNVSSVFANLSYSKLLTFNNTGKKWKSLNNTDTIDVKQGYWIKSNEGKTIGLFGHKPNVNITIYNGLNLVGYPYLEQKEISELFNNSTVYIYNNSKWYSYDPNKPSQLNTLTKLNPGYGYLVNKK